MRFKVRSSSENAPGGGKPASLVGKLVLTAFLSVFVAAGVFFSGMILGEVQDGLNQQGWVERPCVVLASSVIIDSGNNKPYAPQIAYRYDHGGKSYLGTNDSEHDATSSYREAQSLTLAYPISGRATCWVNPNEPTESVLTTGGLETLGLVAFWIVWFGLFSGVPLLIIIGTWWPRRGKNREGQATSARRRGRGKRRSGWVFGLLFGGIFAGAGLAMLFFMTVRPLWRTAMARSWDSVPCVVERSALLRFDDDDGATYRIDVLYFYEVGGVRYGSNRYDFASFGSSSGRDSKQQVITAHPVGAQTTCYVDPNDPTSAVLHRGLTAANWWGLFPLPFFLVGAAVMIGSFRSRHGGANRWRPKPSRKRPTPGGATDPMPADAGPVTLRPRGSRIGKFFVMLFIAAFWNGIVSVFVTISVRSWVKGEPEVCMSLFIIPFVIVGVVLIGVALRQLLLIFAPAVVIELDRRVIPLGGAARLRWHVDGRAGSLSHIRISLVGEEHATYTRGTDTVTDTHSFLELPLVGVQEQTSDFQTLPMLEDRGELVLNIPANTMHSFEAKHNKIVWKLRVSAEVRRWPDPKDDYTITITPAPVGVGPA